MSALLQPGAVSDPPHADGDDGAGIRPSRAVRRRSMPTSRPAASSCAICSSMTTAAGCRMSALLDGLVAEKLKAEAEKIAAEGWKWIEVAVDFPYGHTHGLRELEGEPSDLTRRGAGDDRRGNAEYAKLEAEYAERRRAARRGR